jgi:hypothetical protein
MSSQNDHDLSFILEDGSLVETIFDKEKKYTAFAIGSEIEIEEDNGEVVKKTEVGITESLKLGGQEIKPIAPDNKMLSLGFIKLPAGAEMYGLPLPDITEDARNKYLFSAIQTYLKKYVSLSDDFYPIVALYIMLTWVYERFNIVPYLRVIGGFGTGKSRFLQVVGNACFRPMFFNGSTSVAGVYRTIDWFKGCMIFDESDFKNSELWSDMVKVLNSGHDRATPVVKIETKKDGQMVPRAFYIFGPKVFGSRERYADEALESRCITQRLHYGSIGSSPITLPPAFEIEAGQLRKWLLMFRFKYYTKIQVEDIPMPTIQTPRIKQTFTAIAIVAKLIGEDVLNKILEFGVKADAELRSQLHNSIEVDVLICLLEMIRSREGKNAYAKKISIQQLANHYHNKFYNEFNDQPVRFHKDVRSGDLHVSPNYRISAKKMGRVVSNLGIKKERDGEGYYIYMSEYPRINSLVQHYGITDNMLNLKESNSVSEPETTEVESNPDNDIKTILL